MDRCPHGHLQESEARWRRRKRSECLFFSEGCLIIVRAKIIEFMSQRVLQITIYYGDNYRMPHDDNKCLCMGLITQYIKEE